MLDGACSVRAMRLDEDRSCGEMKFNMLEDAPFINKGK
jgi:hypothetical protein